MVETLLAERLGAARLIHQAAEYRSYLTGGQGLSRPNIDDTLLSRLSGLSILGKSPFESRFGLYVLKRMYGRNFSYRKIDIFEPDSLIEYIIAQTSAGVVDTGSVSTSESVEERVCEKGMHLCYVFIKEGRWGTGNVSRPDHGFRPGFSRRDLLFDIIYEPY